MGKKKIEDAVFRRKERGFRYDNSEYWREYYSRKLRTGDFKREKRYAVFLKSLLPFKTKVLDVATGYGFLPLEIKKAGFENITCIDYFPQMISLAQLYFKSCGENLKVYKQDVARTSFRKGSFGLITAMSILEHFPLEEVEKDLFPEIARLLAPSGFCLIHVPVKSVTAKVKKFYRMRILKDLPSWAIDDDGDVTHKIWFSADEYFDLLQRNGFVVKYVGFNYTRSNERIWCLRLANRFLANGFTAFTPVFQGRLSLRQRLLSLLASSTVFVCQKRKK